MEEIIRVSERQYDYDLFVIGGGSGGVRCARIAAGHGARVGVAEERFWGGTCVNVGCVPKKLMVMAPDTAPPRRGAAGFGWHYGTGRHDWTTLIANKDAEIARLNGIYRKLLGGCGATVFDALAYFVDAHTLDVGGERITAERIVIATGGQPRVPDFPGAQHCIVSDDAFFLPERPRRVVIIGGGYIAVEFAGIFAGLGSEVHLVMRQEMPLRGFDEDMRLGLTEALQANGIVMHRGARIAEVTADRHVRLADAAARSRPIWCSPPWDATRTRPGLGLNACGVSVDGFGAVHGRRWSSAPVPGTSTPSAT